MKITIAPSQNQSEESIKMFDVTVEYKDDESVTTQILVKMFFDAAVGAGYSKQSIHKEMNEF